MPLLHQVHQTTRGRNQNMNPARQRLDLRTNGDPTKNNQGAQMHMPGIAAHTVIDLAGEFARRCQDQDTGLFAQRLTVFLRKVMQ